jgi:hypothetical protein
MNYILPERGWGFMYKKTERFVQELNSLKRKMRKHRGQRAVDF